MYQDLPCPRITDGCPGMVPINMDHCPTCYTQVSAPNVRMANIPEERGALEARYQAATLLSESNGTLDEMGRLEGKISQSQAVVNVSPEFLKQMLTSTATLYASYQSQVGAGTRKPAAVQLDQKRLGVEGFLFGEVGKHITYAALSSNGLGLSSYGSMSVTLVEAAISHRASLMETNSYLFFEANSSAILASTPPLGYRATWLDRIKLGVSKLAGQLRKGMSDLDLDELILSSDGDRSLDNFIEIHIFGTFDNKAIAKVASGATRKSREERLILAGIEEKARNLGIEYRNV